MISFITLAAATVALSPPIAAQPADATAVTLWPIRVGTRYGYINRSGKEVIPPKFNNARHFSGGLAAVKVRSQWGYIKTDGSFAIQPKYEDAAPFINGLALVQTGFDSSSRTFTADQIRADGSVFKSALLLPQGETSRMFSLVESPFYDGEQDTFTFQAIRRIRENAYGPGAMAGFTLAGSSNGKDDDYGDGFQQWQKKGAPIGPKMMFEMITYGNPVLSNRIPFARYSVGDFVHVRYGFMDLNGRPVIQDQYVAIESFYGGLARVWDEEGIASGGASAGAAIEDGEVMEIAVYNPYNRQKWSYIDPQGRKVWSHR